MPRSHQTLGGATLALTVLHLLMLGALFTQTAPHPPHTIAPFALGPFLSMVVSVGAAALFLLVQGSPAGRGLCGAVALLALASYGPQKYFDAAFAQIWVAVVPAQIAAVVILGILMAQLRGARDAVA